MDIAFVSDVMYPWIKGGAEKRTYEVAKRLAKNHEVSIYTMKWWPELQNPLKKDGIEFHAVSKPKELYKGDRRSIKEAFSFAFNSLRVGKEHDVIDFNAFPYVPCFTGKLRSIGKTNFVITWHEVWGDYWYKYLGKKGFFGKVIEKWVSKLPDQIIAVSEQTQKDLKNIGANSKVVPNGIDYRGIQETEPNENGFDVVFAGRLIPEKNVNKLLEAIKDTELSAAIIGDGPEKKRLKEQAESTEIDVEFLGETTYNELIATIKASKVFVSPSSREGFGISVLEALASGTPVVTVDEPNNAAKHLVDEDRGLVVPLDSYQIQRAIMDVLEKNKNKELSKGAKEFSKEFTWDNVAEKTLGVYRELVG